MQDTLIGWLSKDEIVLTRMRSFHHLRVEAIQKGVKPCCLAEGGKLIVHLIPEESIVAPTMRPASKLQQHGRHVSPLGEHGSSTRFNADGLLNFSGSKELRAYTQLYRDGRLEAAMSDASYKQDGGHYLRDRICERALIAVVGHFLKFCKDLGTPPPVWLFTTLADVEGVRLFDGWGRSDYAIDRAVVNLPEIKIAEFDIEPASFLRPLLDCMWNAMGLERSWNYDEAGKRQERQR